MSDLVTALGWLALLAIGAVALLILGVVIIYAQRLSHNRRTIDSAVAEIVRAYLDSKTKRLSWQDFEIAIRFRFGLGASYGGEVCFTPFWLAMSQAYKDGQRDVFLRPLVQQGLLKVPVNHNIDEVEFPMLFVLVLAVLRALHVFPQEPQRGSLCLDFEMFWEHPARNEELLIAIAKTEHFLTVLGLSVRRAPTPSQIQSSPPAPEVGVIAKHQATQILVNPPPVPEPEPITEYTTTCPLCRRDILFERQWLNREMNCPKCWGRIFMTGPANV